MKDKLQQLNDRLATYIDLEGAAYTLEWDQETYMPPGGVQARADQLATLEELMHRTMTDEAISRLLEELAPYETGLDYDSHEASLIRMARRQYEKRVRVPAELVGEIERTAALGHAAWVEARQQNNFARFQPLLEKMLDLKIQWAECFQPYATIYDPLLDYYDPGITREQIRAVFDGLRPPLVELVHAISANTDAVDDSPVRRRCEPEAQLAFSRQVAETLGYDFERGRLDLSAHPFTIPISRLDVRITTRIDPDFLPGCLMSVIHETGHALYEQNFAPELYRTILVTDASMSIHESQSRFYENILGRSRAFSRYLLPRLQAALPQFGDVNAEALYRAMNKSQPSLIRTEADEVTYGLHIMLRFELEDDLLHGRVKVADLPQTWNERMEAYLGLIPPTDSDGVLQDIHWSQGYIGYFPDYLLGSIFAVQLWEALQQDIPDAEQQFEAGQFEPIGSWLREKVHKHGVKFTLPELAERVTGGPLDWQPYMAYLQAKYGELYGL